MVAGVKPHLEQMALHDGHRAAGPELTTTNYHQRPHFLPNVTETARIVRDVVWLTKEHEHVDFRHAARLKDRCCLFGDVVARASQMIVDRNDDAAGQQEVRAPNDPPRQAAVPRAFRQTAHCTATRLCFSSTPLASNTSTTL